MMKKIKCPWHETKHPSLESQMWLFPLIGSGIGSVFSAMLMVIFGFVCFYERVMIANIFYTVYVFQGFQRVQN